MLLEVGLGVNEDLGNDQEMDDEVDIAMNNEGDWLKIWMRKVPEMLWF